MEKYRRILSTMKGEIRNSADNSKFRFWMRSKGFRIGDDDQLLVVSPSGVGYKRVAVVEEFYDIIYGVHVADVGGKSGFHAGQKKTYRAVTERYAFLPREAVTKFLLGCAECQRRVDTEMTPLSSRYHASTVPDYLPINLTTKNCVIRLTVPNFKNDWSSTPTKRMRMSSSSEDVSPIDDISPISTDDSLCVARRHVKQGMSLKRKAEMRVSPDPEVDEEVNGRNGDTRPDAEDMWSYNLVKKQASTPQRDLSSPLQESGSVHDETSSSGNKDDDDDDEEDDLKAPHHDSERLKAFNMFVRLFVDENLDRCVPISRQPKEKEKCKQKSVKFLIRVVSVRVRTATRVIQPSKVPISKNKK
ncbi:hypothetical protein GE061_008613 [Apolygus lucorum]|uniref:Nucleolar protein 4 helical domain-containing protein n=1 Tax=Apolygus lucorum TaxID=248454 RepID=A0A8S9WL82_APOLU|nr:hypothetical protein GE061_008613 [Apolygus lucorum]